MKNQIAGQSISLLFLCFALLSATGSAQKTKSVMPHNRKSTSAAIESLEKDIPNLMKLADIPGMSAALVRDGKIVWSKGFGVKNADTKESVAADTVFEAASLSKVVFAYAVMKLVDEGKIDLDVPLNKYLDNNYDVGDDARLNLITARRVLSHTSGFPNWRADENGKLPINFTPGEKFSYSGEGIVYLSKVVEKITGMNLEDFMQKTVFAPLRMNDSSYMWLDKYDKRATYRHDGLGNKPFRNQGKTVNAAASLRTTVGDYARFIIALMNGEGLTKKSRNEMLKPHVNVNEKSPQVFWGLGVGLETTEEGKSFWHWGDQGNSKAYFTAFLPTKDAVVYFANNANGLSFTQEILNDAIGGKHPGAAWLNYPRYDSPGRNFLKSAMANGSKAALKNYLEERTKNAANTISEAEMNTIGYQLLQSKKVDDAIEIFLQNTIDFPNSANVWDSLAESYMTKGDKESAIKYYEKSLELNPKNGNAIEQLKKLKP